MAGLEPEVRESSSRARRWLAGLDGLDDYRRILPALPGLLAPGRRGAARAGRRPGRGAGGPRPRAGARGQLRSGSGGRGSAALGSVFRGKSGARETPADGGGDRVLGQVSPDGGDLGCRLSRQRLAHEPLPTQPVRARAGRHGRDRGPARRTSSTSPSPRLPSGPYSAACGLRPRHLDRTLRHRRGRRRRPRRRPP